MRVLVVENHVMMRRIIFSILDVTGIYKVHSCACGDEAIALLRALEFDLVVTDYEMTDGDGIDILRWVRRSDGCQQTELPILVVTAHSDPIRIKIARDAGANEVLCKPISARSLLNRIAFIFEHPRTFIYEPSFVGPDRRRKTDSGYAGPERRTQGGYSELSILP